MLSWHSDGMGQPPGSVRLPDDLAPSLRAAALALLAEVKIARHPPLHPPKRPPINRCHFCGGDGPMVDHHVVPGDHSTIVYAHPSCHRKHHARERRLAERTA